MEQDTLYSFPKDCKKEMIVKAVISKRSVERVSFLPVYINNQAQPEALKRGDDGYQEKLGYAEWVSDQFPHSIKVEGNEGVVQSPDTI